MKPEYGPTLGRLLAPRWRSTSGFVRAAVVGAGLGVLVLAIAVALTLEKAHYSHGQGFPFSFSYRDLYRTSPDPGGYVKVQSKGRDGDLEYSYAVQPLELPPYAGALSGELPIYASRYIDQLEGRYSDFVLRGESGPGSTRCRAMRSSTRPGCRDGRCTGATSCCFPNSRVSGGG